MGIRTKAHKDTPKKVSVSREKSPSSTKKNRQRWGRWKYWRFVEESPEVEWSFGWARWKEARADAAKAAALEMGWREQTWENRTFQKGVGNHISKIKSGALNQMGQYAWGNHAYEGFETKWGMWDIAFEQNRLILDPDEERQFDSVFQFRGYSSEGFRGGIFEPLDFEYVSSGRYIQKALPSEQIKQLKMLLDRKGVEYREI